MIINSGVTSIANVFPFEVGNNYKLNDIVYFSGYTDPADDSLYPCTRAQSGHYYYSGKDGTVSTISNTPAATTEEDNPTNWTQKFFFEPSYGATVSYKALNYSTSMGDGYYSVLNRSENALRAEFNVSFNKRTDAEGRAIVHLLEDSFNKGNKPSGGYSGINWAPFAPYNLSGEFFIENINHSTAAPEVNSVSTTFFNETVSLTDWKQLHIPYEGTREKYEDGEQYYQNDAAFFMRETTSQPHLVPRQSGWYYFTGEKNGDYTSRTGLKGTIYNSPSGDATLWTKDTFYFDANDETSLEMSPLYYSQDLQNQFKIRFAGGLNKNLLKFSLDFRGRTDKETKAMVHFLEHHQGSSLFNFTPPAPYDKRKVFISSSWQHTLKFKDNNDIRVDFLEFPIDYLNFTRDFRTLITTINRPVTTVPQHHGWGGSVTVNTRTEGAEFVSNTGIPVYVPTGFSLRTGFYLTNSGNVTTTTTIDTSENKYSVFEFPSGSVSNPIVTPPGVTHFVPFYFNGFGANNDSANVAVGSPQLTGYEGFVTLSTKAEVDNEADPSGNITLGITGYISGWDLSPYAGRPSENPMFPSKFLVKTGYYDVSGRPFHYLQWEHPESGYYLTRYNLETSQGPADGFTGLTDFYTDSDDPGRIGFKAVSSYDGTTAGNAGTFDTLLYTGIAFPPSLAQDAIGSPLTDPVITGYHQPRSVLHTELETDTNYYYRIRSEFKNAAGGTKALDYVTGSMYVYASGVDDLNKVVGEEVYTGLGLNSFAQPITSASQVHRIRIPAGSKPAMRIFLPHGSTNLNLSGLFIQELVNRGVVTQTDGLDNVPGIPYETSPQAWLNVANTGAYGDNFTGIQYILRPNFVVGSTDSANPSIDTGYQLLTGVVNPADATAGGDPNLQKPIKETPTVLVMQYNSVVAGKGGAGGDGGYTLVKNAPTIRTNELVFEFSKTANSTVGSAGGHAIKISDTDIADFRIRKDYTAKVLGGGGGGGGGDRFLVEKIFALQNSKSYKITDFVKGKSAGGGLSILAGLLAANPALLLPNTKVIKKEGQLKIVTSTDKASPDEMLLSTLGTHYGGPGGGGQGYIVSEGGRQLSPDEGLNSLNIKLRGGFYGPGAGYTSPNQQTRHSEGGAGGGYGESGVKGKNMDELGSIDPFTIQDDTVGQLGGGAGNAIRVISGNTNYTKSNFRSALIEITPSKKTPADIPGLVANFDSSQNVYSAYTNESTNTAATNGQSIVRWASTNNSGDSGIYMEQTTNANNNRPTYRTADYTNFKGTTLYKRYFNDAPFIYFDPAYYGYHATTPTRPGPQYFKLINATVDQNYTGAIRINSSGKTYQPGLYSAAGVGIAVASLPSKLLANDVVYFAGGGEFQLAADAVATDTALFGTLRKRQVDDGEYGSNRLSPFMNGFDIFYVIYPDKWDAEGNYVGGRPAFPEKTDGPPWREGGRPVGYESCWLSNDQIAGGTNNKTCTYTSGNTTITAPNVTDIKVGEMVIGTDIPVNTKVSSISAPSVVLSVAPTASEATGKTLTFVHKAAYDDVFQVGWMRWSAPFVKPKGDGTGFDSAYYHRCAPAVKENAGVSGENTNNYLVFQDLNMATEGSQKSAELIRQPRSAWVYNVSAQRKNGLISLLVRCNGVPVGEQQFKTSQEAFDFLSSGNVLIGASSLLGEYKTPFAIGYKGALAHMVVYNRLLASNENRNILGFLYNKYLTVKGSDAGDPLSVDTVNAFSDNNGFAGQILFE